MKAVAPTTFARMSESLMSRKPLHKRLSRGFATCRSLPPIVGKNWRQKLPGGSPQGCEIPGQTKTSTRKRYLGSIRSFCKWAYNRGLLEEDIAGKLEPIKVKIEERRYLSEAEVDAFIDAVAH